MTPNEIIESMLAMVHRAAEDAERVLSERPAHLDTRADILVKLSDAACKLAEVLK